MAILTKREIKLIVFYFNSQDASKDAAAAQADIASSVAAAAGKLHYN